MMMRKIKTPRELSMQTSCVCVVLYPDAFLCSASFTDLSQSARYMTQYSIIATLRQGQWLNRGKRVEARKYLQEQSDGNSGPQPFQFEVQSESQSE
jgi:hypothetical protein